MFIPYAGPTDTDLIPDDDCMHRFLAWWFSHCNRGCIEIDWLDPVTGRLDLLRRFPIDADPIAAAMEAARFAAETNARPGCNTYFRPGTVRPESANTTDHDVIELPGFWADCDAEESLERAWTCVLPPAARILTGSVPHDRGQAFWQLNEPAYDPDMMRTLNRQVQALTGGDPMVVNVGTLMRLPGSISWPYKPGRIPELVEWTDNKPGHACTLKMAQQHLPPVPDETVRVNGTPTDTTALLNPLKALIRQAVAGPEWHKPTLKAVAMMVNRGWPDWQILDYAERLTWPSYTVEQTRAELTKMIEGARRKGFGEPDDEAAPDEPVDNVDEVMRVEPAAPTTFPLLTDTDLATMPDPEWLIPDLLVANTLCVLYGPWGSYKSFLALDFALCLATGTPWLERQVCRCDVLYIAGEGVGGLKLRVAAWKRHHDIAEHIHGFRVVPLAVNLMDKAEAERLILTTLEAQKADGFTPRLVIVDTLHRSMPGAEENSAKDMGVVVSNGALIQRKLSCTLLPIHHAGKDAEKGMRGSSGLPGDTDTILKLTREDERATLLVEKQKDGEDGQEFQLRSQAIALPPTPGSLKSRNSLILVKDDEPPANASLNRTGEKTGKVPPGRALFYEALTAAITKSSIGTGKTLLGSWEMECLRRNLIERPVTGETYQQRDARYRPFRRAKSDLLAAKWLTIEDDTVFDLKGRWG